MYIFENFRLPTIAKAQPSTKNTSTTSSQHSSISRGRTPFQYSRSFISALGSVSQYCGTSSRCLITTSNVSTFGTSTRSALTANKVLHQEIFSTQTSRTESSTQTTNQPHKQHIHRSHILNETYKVRLIKTKREEAPGESTEMTTINAKFSVFCRSCLERPPKKCSKMVKLHLTPPSLQNLLQNYLFLQKHFKKTEQFSNLLKTLHRKLFHQTTTQQILPSNQQSEVPQVQNHKIQSHKIQSRKIQKYKVLQIIHKHPRTSTTAHNRTKMPTTTSIEKTRTNVRIIEGLNEDSIGTYSKTG